MKQVVVRYKLKADKVAEHETLLAAVFAQLAERLPPGPSYKVLKLEDGVSFIHFAVVASPQSSPTQLPAFKLFTADLNGRCAEPPVSAEGKVQGAYNAAAPA